MTQREFHAALRLLMNLEPAGLGLSSVGWERFNADPVRFFIRCDDETCDKIWAAMEKRMAPKAALDDERAMRVSGSAG